MTEDRQNVKETIVRSGDTIEKTTDTRNSRDDNQHNNDLISRVVWYLAGLLLIVLGLRFVLTLLGANPSNGFANFIYSLSHPLVTPFFSLFNYRNYAYGTSHFELYTLIAILVYVLIAWGIVRLVTITRKFD